jgi:Sulfotransferase domain
LKIFSIGFHRTGTRSLHAFLSNSGLRAIHWPHWVDGVCYEALTIPHLADRGEVVRLLRPVIERHDAFSDVPFPALYRELCEIYPGSRFILVTRNLDLWWRSLVQHWKLDQRVFRALDPYELMQYNLHGGTPLQYVTIKDKSLLVERHEQHVAAVFDFFSKSDEALLSVDLDDAEIAQKLSDFLGVPCRSPFPRAL